MRQPLVPLIPDLGLLILRLCAGGFMALFHGWGKFQAYGEKVHEFRSMLGMSPEVGYTLLVGAEFGCALLIVLGLCTRLAALPLIFAMLVAAFIAHGDDPMDKKELPLLYALQYAVLFFMGAGRFSVDHWWGTRQAATASTGAEISA